MKDRERFVRIFTYRNPDRSMFFEWMGYWEETVNRWYGEGLPYNLNVEEFFGFDRGARLSSTAEIVPIDAGPIPARVPRVLGETERYRICVDEIGAVLKTLKTSVSIPNFIDFPVKTQEDWGEMKKRFDPRDPRRYPKYGWEELIEYYETTDRPVGIRLGHVGNGFFGTLRDLMGLQRLIIAFYREPDWVHEMLDFWADFFIEVTKPAVENIKVDWVGFWEDMAYSKGPHISPKLFREFILPRYKKVTGYLRHHGIEVITVDSDGNTGPLVPLFLEGGVNVIEPCEAVMDIVALKRQYGKKLGIIGGIDKKALIAGGEHLRKEVEEKVPKLISQGGYIPGVDHLVPSNVPFAHYVEYVKLLKKHIFGD